MFDAFPLSKRYFVFSWVFVFVRFIVFSIVAKALEVMMSNLPSSFFFMIVLLIIFVFFSFSSWDTFFRK